MSAEHTPSRWPRWRIEGRYTVEASLHLGDGDFREHPLTQFGREAAREDDPDARPASVVRDGDGRPFIPASSLRGAIRAALWRYYAGADKAIICQLYNLFGFGPEEAKAAALEGFEAPAGEPDLYKDGLGGRLSFVDAFAVDNPAGFQGFLDALCNGATDPDRAAEFRAGLIEEATYVEASVALEPATRTVKVGQFANREVVPPGTAFDVVVTGAGLSNEEVSLLLRGLSLLADDAAGLGGGRKMGAGRLCWDEGAICRFGKADLAAWLEEAKQENGASLNAAIKAKALSADEREQLRGSAPQADATSGWAQTAIELAFDGPFLVCDPIRSEFQKRGEEGADAMPRVDRHGAAILPGRSFKGALRARAHRIERTLFEGSGEVDRCANWLFGTITRGAAVEFEDLREPNHPANQRRLERQHFVAIDRFTGGQAAGKLYQFMPLWSPTLTGKIRLDLRRLGDVEAPRALGLLLLTLRDLEAGDLQFGLGAAKGYGACKAKFPAGLDAFFKLTLGTRLMQQLAITDMAVLLEHFSRGAPNHLGPEPINPQPVTTLQDTNAPTGARSARRALAGTPSIEFINPYNFVPVIKTEDKQRWYPNKTGDKAFQAADGHKLGRLRHDRWLKEDNGEPLHSGRILCRLVTENPTFIGAGSALLAEQQAGRAKKLRPFELVDGVPAIPASSLRGLFSSIAEAASQSSLRILTNRILSFRMAATPQNLPRLIGVVDRTPTAPPGYSLVIRPLCRLDIERGPGGYRQRRTSLRNEPPVRVPDWVRDRYDELIKERIASDNSDDARRYYLKKLGENAVKYGGRASSPEGNWDASPQLSPGHVVFYQIGADGTASHIAPSQIWRRRVERLVDGEVKATTTFDFFREIDCELLPFEAAKRQQISPAELIFGFVSDTGKEAREPRNRDSALEGAERPAYAGRVRFSFGRMADEAPGGHYGDERTLKILSSPKPPCPPFYFKKRGGRYGTRGYIAKADLALDQHMPNGRKFYHDHGLLDDAAKLRVGESGRPDEDPGQKVRIAPIKAGKTFYFHVDFDNLNRWELGLLCYALQPNPTYRHRIGTGKRLGLGRTKIDPLALFEIDRFARYLAADSHATSPYADNRAHRFFAGEVGALRQRYGAEAEALGGAGISSAGFAELAKHFRETANPLILKAIECFGEDPPRHIPVTQPQLEGYDEETETFRWYVSNDRRARQSLPSLLEGDDKENSPSQIQMSRVTYR